MLSAAAADAGSKLVLSGAAAATNAVKETTATTFKTAAMKELTVAAYAAAGALRSLAGSSAGSLGNGIIGALSGFLGGGGASGGLGGAASAFASAFGGFRANGGPVYPGSYYTVGERGPETFVPNVPGFIVPNGGFGSAQPVINVVDRSTYNITGASTAEVAQLRQQMQQDQATRRQQTVGFVREALRRPRALGG